MADASLDDFFAKKDKRTKKSKSKLTPAELLARQEAELKAPKKKKEKDKSQNRPAQSSTAGSSALKIEEGQEWNEFKEETEKDYSGLRIQNLQISKEEEEDDSEGQDSDEEGDGEEGREGKDGPWRKSQLNQQSDPLEQAPPEPEPVVKTEEPKPTGKYVPPSQRYAATASATSKSSQMRRKKGAPNLGSEEDFPTLGGGPVGSGGVRWGEQDVGDRHFEQVRGGNKQMEDPSNKSMSLTLGNKFQALKQE